MHSKEHFGCISKVYKTSFDVSNATIPISFKLLSGRWCYTYSYCMSVPRTSQGVVPSHHMIVSSVRNRRNLLATLQRTEQVV